MSSRGYERYSRSPAAPIDSLSSRRSASLRSSCFDERRVDLLAALVEQQRIFVRPLRHDAFGEPRDKHDAERPAARLMRRADEDAAVAPQQRRPVERHQPVAQHVARFFERHRSDARHRAKRRENVEHAVGATECPPGQLDEAIEPLAPRRGVRPLREFVDDRQRELAEVTKVLEIAFERGNPRRLRLVAPELGNSQPVVGSQPSEPPPPPPAAVGTRPAANHGRLDDQLFPFPRRPQRARNHRFVVGIERRVLGERGLLGRLRLFVLERPRKEFVARDSVGSGLGLGLELDLRHLAEREVLVESLCRQSFDRARQQRDERPAGRIGPANAAIEIRLDAGACAGVLEKAEVVLRGPDEDGHLVERHAALRFVEHAAHDLDRLPAFTGRREQPHVARTFASRRPRAPKDVTPEMCEIR